MTDADLTVIKARLAAATPGPWSSLAAKPGWDADVGIIAPGCECVLAECFCEFKAKGDRHPEWAEANAVLIAHAPTDLAALIEEVERLREKIRQDQLNNHAYWCQR